MSAEELENRLKAISSVTYEGPVYPRMTLKTSRIAYVLIAGEPGDIIRDEQWPKDLKGVSPKGRSYNAFMSAAKYVLKSGLVVWQRVREEGLVKCLEHNERVDAAKKRLEESRRRTLFGQRTCGATDFSKLSADDRARANSLSAQLAMMQKISAPKVTKELETRDEGQQKNYIFEHLLKSKNKT